MSEITVTAEDGGEFHAHVAEPDGPGPHPGLVVIQEIFGVNDVMRDLCRGYAEQGFLAVCPDLFWRLAPRIELTDKTDEEWQQAFDLMGRFDQAQGVADIQATLRHLRGAAGLTTGRVGAVGYCLGGRMAYFSATRTDSDANVGYYAVGLDEVLGEAGQITKPLMLHIAERDQFVPPETQKAVMDALAGHPQVTIHFYEGVDHAFARPGGAHYDAAAAQLADQRTLDFLHDHLGG